MTKRLQINRSVDGSLRARIAAVASGELCRQQHAIDPYRVWQWFDMGTLADAIIKELDMGIPCATTGCRMRQIARRHAEEE